MAKSMIGKWGLKRTPTPEEIAHVAFHLFLERGSVTGYEQQDWNRAQRLLLDAFSEPESQQSGGDMEMMIKPGPTARG